MISHRIDETQALGVRIAAKLEPGSVLCLTGDLGAGKTTLTQAIMRALGVIDPITSPTYTIVNEYHNPMTIFHDVEEMYEIGFDDYLNQNAILIIEWADLIEEIIPEDAVWIDIKYTGEDSERMIRIRGWEDFDENTQS